VFSRALTVQQRLFIVASAIVVSESFIMPLFLQTSKHNPESCPFHNKVVKKATADLMAKWDELGKKYNVKTIGMWVSEPEHFLVVVYDAPNWEALMKMSMEPEPFTWGWYNISEMRQVFGVEEVMKMMMK
jgi:hypothetical protein